MPAAAIDTVLALAGLPTDAFDVTYDVVSWRVRYTTQDRGQPTEATMLITLPVGAGEVPTLAWFHGTTGFSDVCAPTALGLEGGAFNLLYSSLGYAVVSPDYLGMNGIGESSTTVHPYLVPEASALPNLDAVRAAWTFVPDDDPGSSATRKIVWFGASEGGFAALWADRYQPHYLPEADPVGVVASVPPADLPGIAQLAFSDFSDATEGLVAAVATWHDWYQVEHPLGDTFQAPFADTVLDALEAECSVSLVDGVTTVEELYTEAFVDAVQGDSDAFPDLTCALERTRVATSEVPRKGDVPVLYVVSELDELVLAGPTREAFQPLCDEGYRMNYLECAGAYHVDGAVWSLPEVFDWARDRVDGVPLDDVCVQGPPVPCSLQDAG